MPSTPQGWLVLDLVSVVPWDLVAISAGAGADDAALFRVTKATKLLRAMSLLKTLRGARIGKRLEQNLHLKYGHVRLLKFFMSTILALHWLACALQYVTVAGDHDEFDEEACLAASTSSSVADNWQTSWSHDLYCGCDCSTGDLYVNALYWAVMTLTTIGFGDLSAARNRDEVNRLDEQKNE